MVLRVGRATVGFIRSCQHLPSGSRSTGRKTITLQVSRRFFSNERENGTSWKLNPGNIIEESCSETRTFETDGGSILEKLIEKSAPELPTRHEIVDFLREADLNFETRFIDSHGNTTEYSRFVRTDCLDCGGTLSTHISTMDGETTCTICHYNEPFEVYKKRVVVSKAETTSRDQTVKSEEEKRIEETIRSMENPEELDNDLYDNVSYLNLMSQYRDQQANKKATRLARTRDDSEALSPRAGVESERMVSTMAPADPHIQYLWAGAIDIADLIGSEHNEMLQLRMMLGIERISMDTLSKFNVRGHIDSYDQPAILYPRYRGLTSRARLPVGLKTIRKIGDRMEKESYPLLDDTLVKQRFSGIFGFHMATASDRAVILTTNERDALAVYEATGGALVFALPQGEVVDSQVFPYLEDFDKIIIWFPYRHLDFAKEWGCALNGSRCFLVKSQDRPIELVRNHENHRVNICIRDHSVRIRDKGFRSMTDIRDEVKADLVHAGPRLVGLAQWKRFPALNKYLMGFRPGELTVLTGGTGYGKTTFLCEYALDLFTQGVRTVFCSFEMPEEKILKWMLVQYSGVPLYRVEFSNSIDAWLDKFERTKGPLTIMKTEEFRNKTISDIYHAIRYQVENSGCQHVVIDNLQFLVNQTTLSNDKLGSMEKFNLQDRFVGFMRLLATQYQVHVTMVVHPRKTDSDTDLDIQHFGGSARVTQEADNVLAIQKRRDERDRGKQRKFLHILKNRYGGRRVETDQLEMLFQPATYSHILLDHGK